MINTERGHMEDYNDVGNEFNMLHQTFTLIEIWEYVKSHVFAYHRTKIDNILGVNPPITLDYDYYNADVPAWYNKDTGIHLCLPLLRRANGRHTINKIYAHEARHAWQHMIGILFRIRDIFDAVRLQYCECFQMTINQFNIEWGGNIIVIGILEDDANLFASSLNTTNDSDFIRKWTNMIKEAYRILDKTMSVDAKITLLSLQFGITYKSNNKEV